jgi:putative ABC transport system ATP-binding protein
MASSEHNGPLIRLREICKVYRQGAPVPETETELAVAALDRVSLDIRAGEYCAIQGASGSGKSTLMHILGLLDRPSSGAYLFKGRDVSKLDDDRLSELRNQAIGFVFQSFYLVPYATALDNALMPGLYGPTPQRVLKQRGMELLRLVGLADRARFKPHQLSGGQQQRVALARALINEPDLLLADEPTGQLDSKTSAEILELFDRINAQGATVVVVTHDEQVAGHARRRIRVKDGRVCDEDQQLCDEPSP